VNRKTRTRSPIFSNQLHVQPRSGTTVLLYLSLCTLHVERFKNRTIRPWCLYSMILAKWN